MNPLLGRLQPYPFERLRQLFAGVQPSTSYRAISLGIGEPKHPTPPFIGKAFSDAVSSVPSGLAAYPATAGEPALRAAVCDWMQRRYGLELNPATQVLPVNGSREALFALAQTVIDPARAGRHRGAPQSVLPDLRRCGILLSGAHPYFVAASDPARNFAQWTGTACRTAVWARTQLLYVCSPGNPTGAVMPLSEWKKLFELSDRYSFVIASDECYSEIYFRDEPPLGGLQASASKLGRTWLPQPDRTDQPVQTQQRARHAQRFRGW
jgi:N-succinyldiaminopimelate aminotransferase